MSDRRTGFTAAAVFGLTAIIVAASLAGGALRAGGASAAQAGRTLVCALEHRSPLAADIIAGAGVIAARFRREPDAPRLLIGMRR